MFSNITERNSSSKKTIAEVEQENKDYSTYKPPHLPEASLIQYHISLWDIK